MEDDERALTGDLVMVPREPTQAMLDAGRIPGWDDPEHEGSSIGHPETRADVYRAMIAAAPAASPIRADADGVRERLNGMLKMAVLSEDNFNRLSPAGRQLLQEAEGFFAASHEDQEDLQTCWDALQAETKRADAAEARLVSLSPEGDALDRVAKALHVSCSQQDIMGYLGAKIDCTVLARAALTALKTVSET